MSSRRTRRNLLFLLLVFTIGVSQSGAAITFAQLAGIKKAPPKTRAENITDTVFGIPVADPYRWLEDQESAETRAWIDEQNRYTDSILNALPNRDRISRRLSELFKIDTISAPVERGGRYFFTKRRADQQQPVIFMRENGQDIPLVDPNTWSKDQTSSAFISDVSKDGKLLFYGRREGGADETVGLIMDVDSRKELPDRFPRARYFGISFTPDKRGVYYTRFQNRVGSRVMYHEMGTDVAKDAEIFGSGYGPTQIIQPDVSRDGRWLVMFVQHGSAARKIEVYVKDIEKNGPVTTIVNDLDATFNGTIEGDKLYLLTNWQSPNRRVIVVDLKNPARASWRTIIPEGQFAITGMRLAGGKLFINHLENVSTRMKAYEVTGAAVETFRSRSLAAPALCSASGTRTKRFMSLALTNNLRPSIATKSLRVSKRCGRASTCPSMRRRWKSNRSGTSPKTRRGFPCFWSTRRASSSTAKILHT